MTEQELVKSEIKKQLNGYRELRAERDQLLEELRQLERCLSTPGGSNMDGMPRSPGAGNPVERLVVKLVTLQERYKAQLLRLAESQEQIEEMIQGLVDPVERRLARFRYIDGLTWEDVCDKMCYSWRQTHRIHGRLLDKLAAAELERRNAQK